MMIDDRRPKSLTGWDMLLRRTLFAAFALSLASLTNLAAQNAPMPTDPVALISLAQSKNGLESDDVKPWHIRGSYTTYDTDGKVSDSGVYEEWWVSAARYKRSFTSTKFSQVEYATGTGLYRTGSQEWLGGSELLLRTQLIDPLPPDATMKELKPILSTKTSGKSVLNCVTLSYPIRSNVKVLTPSFYVMDCVQQDVPALRVSSYATYETLYNELVLFQRHYLARELHVLLYGKPAIDLKLDVIEGLKNPDDTFMSPPTGSASIDLTNGPIRLSSHDAALLRVKEAIPEISTAAKRVSADGTVVMDVTVGKDGHVSAIQVKSGPTLLQDTAAEAIRQSVYRPFLVMGQPTEVIFEVKFNFKLGKYTR